MRKTLTIGMAAITAAVGMLSAGTSASARDYYDRHGRYHRDRNDSSDALAAGVVGLALGAALASGGDGRRYDRGYYGRGYYDRGYYDRRYYYDGPRYYAPPRHYSRRYYRSCRNVRIWDPYYGPVYERRCW